MVEWGGPGADLSGVRIYPQSVAALMRFLRRAFSPAFRAGSLYPLARGGRRIWRGEVGKYGFGGGINLNCHPLRAREIFLNSQGRRDAARPAHAPLAACRAFAAYLRPLRKIEWVVYSKRPFGGPEAVLAYLSRYTHRNLQQSSDLARRCRRHLPMEGLSCRWSRPPEGHDTLNRRVHPSLPDPRPAARLPPNPPLRSVRQRHRRRQHRTCP